jgi:Ca2+/H+ antiporter
LLEFHVIGSWNPDIVPGTTVAMGGSKAKDQPPRIDASGLCQKSLTAVVTICIAVAETLQWHFANYASARLFVANTILLRNLFS